VVQLENYKVAQKITKLDKDHPNNKNT